MFLDELKVRQNQQGRIAVLCSKQRENNDTSLPFDFERVAFVGAGILLVVSYIVAFGRFISIYVLNVDWKQLDYPSKQYF